MIKRILVQVAVIGVGAVALLSLGGVSNALAGRRPITQVDTAGQVDSLQGELKVTRAELERAHQVLEFSGRYGIPGDLSARIYDNAVAEGIPPAVGFQLVNVESRFQNGVQSGASAIGLTQLRLPTARVYDTTVGPSDLMNPDVNLRIGFRYLKDLLKRFDQDVELALEAYNKGPTLIAAQQDSGSVVKGRYSRAVMSGTNKNRRGS
jgi:soluble lytic murein transglycosylase-like protein